MSKLIYNFFNYKIGDMKMYFNVIADLKIEEILIYLRKSRSDDPALTVEEVLERHEARLQEWAERNFGKKIPEENIYREVVSGETIEDRPKVKILLSRIESPKVKAILIVEPQRLSRGDLEDAGRIIKLFRYSNTIICTPHETFDLRNERDRDIFERELKRGNEFLEYQKKIMRAGREQSVRNGNFIGSIAPYGYEKIQIMEGKKKCHTLKIYEPEAEIVRMIFDMYVNQDMGRVSIARYLNDMGVKAKKGGLWAQDAIKDMLENEHYIGKVRWNWRKTVNIVEDGEIRQVRPKTEIGEYLVYDGKHEPIISNELFYGAREKQGRNHRAKPSTKVRNPLAGLLFCRCGRAMSLRTYKHKDGSERSAPRLLCDNQAYCKTSSCLYDEIIDRVIEVLEQCIQDFEVRIQNNTEDSAKHHATLIKRLKSTLEELNKKEISQWEKYTEDNMPQHVFDALNAKVLAEKEEIQQALCKAYESMPESVDYEEKVYRFKDALAALKDPNVEAAKKNKLLKACIDRIDYSREKAERTKTGGAKRVTINGKRVRPGGKVGAQWTNPQINLDIKLRL
jgi:hypothetical protein